MVSSTVRSQYCICFNLHFEDNSETYSVSMKTLLANRNFVQVIDKPTHRKKHILDWVIIRDGDNTLHDIEVVDKCISDHFVITFCVNTLKPKSAKRQVISRNVRSIDSELFSTDIKSALPVAVGDVDTLVDRHNSALVELLDKHAPLQTRLVSQRKSAPWLTDDIRKAKQERRKAERSWRHSLKSKVPIDDCILTVLRQIFQSHNVCVNNLIKCAKRDFCLSKIKDCKSSKALFAITGQFSGKIKAKVFPNDIAKCEQPDKFCSFFKDKVEGIRNELSTCVNEPIFEPFSGVIFDEFENVSAEFVKDVIMSSAPKSCMLDPIPVYGLH